MVTRAIDIDERSLDQGYTLPSEWYTQEEFLRLERDVVFGRYWQFLGWEAKLPAPGSYFTATLGFVPVVVTRDLEGRVHAMANVCPHRGALVAEEGEGRCKLLQCPYHAWTFKLDGSLNRAPAMEGIPGFRKEDYGLRRIRAEQWGPFIFGCLDDTVEPLLSYLGGFPDLVSRFGLDFRRLKWRERREYPIRANWKVVVENFLECYHCPGVHPSFSAVQDVQRYRFYGIGKYFTSQGGPVRPTAGMRSDLPEGCYSFIWPNFSFNLFPGAAGAVTMLWLPQGVDRTVAVFDFFYADEVDDEEARASTEFVDQVQREDIVVCESVQRGLGSGVLIQGRLNTDMSDPAKCEIALQHFQKLVFRALSGRDV